MKELKRIEELLEKYYLGETSTEEENILRSFFETGDIPEHLQADAGLFGFFINEREASLSGEMEERLEKMISLPRTRTLTVGMKYRYYWMSAAAVILILLGIFIDQQIRDNSPLETRKDTFEDPYLAYAEAKKALYLVSEKLNTGRKPLKNLEKLDTGVDYMHPIFSFGASIQHLEHFEKIEQTKKLISK